RYRGCSRYAAQGAGQTRAEVEHADPRRAEVDAGHPGFRLVNLRKVRLGGLVAEIAVRSRRVLSGDTVHLTDFYLPADGENLRRERLGIDRHGGIRVARSALIRPAGCLTCGAATNVGIASTSPVQTNQVARTRGVPSAAM